MRLEPDRGPVVPQQWDGAPRGAIVTAAGPQMRTVLHELALPSFRRYADRWGWTVRPTDLAQDGAGADPDAQQAKWAKVSLLRQALRWYPLVLWLDADVLLTRVDEDVTTHLHPAAFQALALEHVPHEHRVNPNTGVWLLRSCPQAFAFLDAVDVAGPSPVRGRTRGRSSPHSAGTSATKGITGPGPVPVAPPWPAPAGCRPAGTSPTSRAGSTRTCSTAAPGPTPAGRRSPTRMPCTSWA